MAADYRAGKPIGDVDWRRVWQALPELAGEPMERTCPPGMPLPPGWSYENLTRHKPRKVETVAARQGPHAARKFSSRVHSTRAELPVGAQYEFDDMWHNCIVVRPGYPKAVRPLELACIDISSAHKVDYGLKPRMEDANGRRTNINEADMRFLVAHVLCNFGYHREGCTLLVERGTAAIRDRLETVLKELSGGLIKVSHSGVDRRIPLGKWGYNTRGNPDHKAHIEAWNNLAQNRLDNLPGYTGSNSRLDKPEDHEALVRVVDRMLAAACHLPAHLAERLKFPVLDWDTFQDTVEEVYAQISWSNDHDLEGWHTRTERQWRCHPADVWHSEADFLRLPPEAQKALAPIVAREGMSRAGVKLSRRQVWERGQADLIRLPDWAVTLICGDDLATPRPAPPAEITFENAEIDARPMAYRLSTCTDAHGHPVQLKDGETYLWMINPFDPRSVFVKDTWGRYVGKCARIEEANRADMDAIGREIGRARRDFDSALAPLAARSATTARRRIAELDANAALLREAAAQRDAERNRQRALSAERNAATRGITLDDLANPENTDEPDSANIGLDDLT